MNRQSSNARSSGSLNPFRRGARAALAFLLLGLLCCGVAASAHAQVARRRSPRAKAPTVKAPTVEAVVGPAAKCQAEATPA